MAARAGTTERVSEIRGAKVSCYRLGFGKAAMAGTRTTCGI